MTWISVKEKLPELYDYVLVVADYKGTGEPKPIHIARLEREIGWAFLGFTAEDSWSPVNGAWSDIEYDLTSEDITHWMPLPNPPMEKECP